jgi:3D (Asp-Asp-Asp) domain-containing protein
LRRKGNGSVDDESLYDVVFGFRPPQKRTKSKELTLWATYYNVYPATAVQGGQPLLDEQGAELGPTLDVRDFCLAALEGTVKVTDADKRSVTYNFAARGKTSQCDCSPYVSGALSPAEKDALGRTLWEVAGAPFGTGERGMRLVPFRSIAVDPRSIPLGSVIYIPRARGRTVTLPSGRVAKHDGYFYAADTGGGVRASHIDVFLGQCMENPFENFVRSDENDTFLAYLVKDDAIRLSLAKLHGDLEASRQGENHAGSGRLGQWRLRFK